MILLVFFKRNGRVSLQVQQYMKKKRQEWKKKQKDEVALSHAAMRAKKEKLEALEMERRARLCW